MFFYKGPTYPTGYVTRQNTSMGFRTKFPFFQNCFSPNDFQIQLFSLKVYCPNPISLVQVCYFTLPRFYPNSFLFLYTSHKILFYPNPFCMKRGCVLSNSLFPLRTSYPTPFYCVCKKRCVLPNSFILPFHILNKSQNPSV